MYDHHMTKWQNYGKDQLFIANGTDHNNYNNDYFNNYHNYFILFIYPD